MRPQLGAGGGEVCPPAHPLEQRHPDLELELPELDGDGRLREVELLGRAAEMQMPGGGGEDSQLSEGDAVQHRRLLICLSTSLNHLNCLLWKQRSTRRRPRLGGLSRPWPQVTTDGSIVDPRERYRAGVLKYAQMGYWQPDYVPSDTDLLGCVPHHAAGRRRSRGGGRRGRRKIIDRDLDRRLDRPADGLRTLPRQGLKIDPASPAPWPRPGQYFAYIAYDLDLFEPGSIANLTASIIGNVFGFKPLKALRLEDMRIPVAYVKTFQRAADRHRRRARTPRQVRTPAARSDGQAEARTVRKELWARGLRGPQGRSRLHQGRREHQQASRSCTGATVSSIAWRRSIARRRRRARSRGTYLNVTAATMEDMYERAEFAKELGSVIVMIERRGARLFVRNSSAPARWTARSRRRSSHNSSPLSANHCPTSSGTPGLLCP